MIDMLLVLLIFLGTIFALIFTRFKAVEIFSFAVLMGVAMGSLSIEQLQSSATNSSLMILILLFFCTSVLEKTTLINHVKKHIISPSLTRTYWRLVSVTAFFSAFLNNTAVVSTLMSIVQNNRKISPAKLLIPLSYAAILGGTTTLIGTSTNLIVNGFLEKETNLSLAFLDFLPLGVSVTFVCLVVLYFLLPWLPEISPKKGQTKAYFIETSANANSKLIGRTVSENGLRHLDSLFLVEIIRQSKLISPVSPYEKIEGNDRLIFSGDVSAINQLQQFDGLELYASDDGLLDSNLVEVMISSRSSLIDKLVRKSGFRAKFDAAIVGVRRDGEELSGKIGDIKIREGDSLILAVGQDFYTRNNLEKNFYVVSDIPVHKLLNEKQSLFVFMGFVAVILFSALNVVPLLQGLFYFLALLLLTKMTNGYELSQRIPFQLWIIITSALSLASMLEQSGVLTHVVDIVKSSHVINTPFQALVVLYIATLILTELMTNNAAAALIFPLAIIFSETFQVDVKPFAMAVAMGASASFISPYGYQTNLMVFNLGQYHKKDFAKVGWVISVFYGLTVIFLLPHFFPF